MALPGSPEAGQAAADSSLPGRTVDDLRGQGKSAEARVEFERLLQEGMESGVDPRLPAAIFDSVRAEIRSRGPSEASGTVARSEDNAGARG